MGDVVNLRQVRKTKTRADKESRADANRALSGRSKAEKRVQRIERERLTRFVDGHKLGDDPAR